MTPTLAPDPPAANSGPAWPASFLFAVASSPLEQVYQTAAEMIQDPEMYPSYETDVVNFLDRLASLPAAAYHFDACES